MSYYVRKIARAKWPETACDINSLPADAISDLRTTGNTLSVWRIDSLSDLDKAALALAASSKSDKIETISLIWIDEEEILHNSFATENSEGDTIVEDLSSLHRDFVGLTYASLGSLSSLIIKSLELNQYQRYTKAKIKSALLDAFKNSRIPKERCHPALYDQLQNMNS